MFDAEFPHRTFCLWDNVKIMRSKLFFLSLAGLLTCSSLMSQSPTGECGTEATPLQMEFMRKNISLNEYGTRAGRSSETIINIPVKVHVIRQSNGTGGLSESQVNQAIDNLNGYFQNSNMMFFVYQGINFIDNSDFYDLNSSQEGAVAVPNDVSGAINVYFSNTLSSTIPLCGYTRFPPSEDRVFVANGCIEGGTFEHEMGHYFTLYHTHGKTNGGTTDELVDGSNCTTAGDDICDTPADPNLTNKVSASCAYTAGEKDANGDSYAPMTNNIMSYSLDQCQNMLTAGQYARARAGFESGRSYLNFTSSGFTAFFNSSIREICPDTEVSFESNSFGAVSYNWSFPGGTPNSSTSKNPKITYKNGGSFGVTLIATNNSGQEATYSRSNYIIVDDPRVDAISDPVSVSFAQPEIDEGIKIDNPDGRVGFTISNKDSNEDENSYSIFIDNFNYETDVLGNVDYVILPTLLSEGIRGFSLSFDYAYTFKPSEFDGTQIIPPRYDTLNILLGNNCGVGAVSVWSKGGEELATASSRSDEFIPEMNDWEEFKYEHEFSSEFDFAILSLENISYNGNNLFIDNIEIVPDYDLYSPIGLRVDSRVNGAINLSWRDQSINETGFIIEKALDGENYIDVDTVSKNIKTYSYVISEEVERISFRVKALGIFNNISEPSKSVDVSILGSGDDFKNSDYLYPMPFTDYLEVTNTNCKTYEIFSLSGKLQVRGQVIDGIIYDLNRLEKGTYIMLLKDNIGTVLKHEKIFK